jgi:hypothetical protein
LRLVLHLCFGASLIGLVVFPQSLTVSLMVPLLLSAVMASYSLRLSNHLVLGWFLGVALAYDGLNDCHGAFFVATMQVLVPIVYFLAFFHKLNREYLSPETSCGYGLARLYSEDRKLPAWLRPGISVFAIYGVLVIEGALPLLLSCPQTQTIGVSLAIVMQVQFGFLCHPHFAFLMLACLCSFLSSSLVPDVLLIGAFAGGLLGVRLGVVSIFRHPRAAVVLQACLGAAGGVIFLGIVTGNFGVAHASLIPDAEVVPLALLAFLFGVNGLSPYLGVKSEFSFAMFSNLKPLSWSHLIVRRPIRSMGGEYVVLHSVSGLPDDCLDWTIAFLVLTFEQSDEQVFFSYFFFEAMKTLSRVAGRPIAAVFTWRGQRLATSDIAAFGRTARYAKFMAFPFRLPRDHSLPHCA